MIRVVLADDHASIRAGVTIMLANAPGMVVAGEASSPESLFGCLARTACDVVVTDFSMPDGAEADGLVMLERLRRLYPEVAVVVLTMVLSAPAIEAMVSAGCHGICDKGAASADIVAAIRAASQGRAFRSAAMADALTRAQQQRVLEPTAVLSPKELEVVRLLAQGHSLPQIAERLHRSRKTASRHKCTAMQRLGLASDDALRAYARATGLG